MSHLLRYDRLDFSCPDADRLVSWQKHYRLDDQAIAAGLGTRLGPRASDLLDISMAVYVADRLCPRRPKGARDDGRHWSRRLPVRVAVRDVSFWTSNGVLELLHELLVWLTDDEWTVEPVARVGLGRFAETQGALFASPLQQPAQAGLLSGGLDSLLGAERDLHESRGELLLVAAATHNKLGHLQREIARRLAAHGPRSVRLLVVPVGLKAAARQLFDYADEPTQRTRGLIFLAFGAVAADAAGLDELRVYENGVGALNLPQTPAGRGAMNTRAVRPETLVMVAQLMSLLRDRPFRIVNPSFWRTKAEMCRDAPADLQPLMAMSVSCDTGLTHRASTVPLCGTCTSCLLRHQALLAGGHEAVAAMDLRRMRSNALGATRPSRAAPGLVSMLAQAMTLEVALQATDPWGAIVDRFPDLPSARDVLNCDSGALLDLLQRYVQDWRAVNTSVVGYFLPSPASAVPA